MRDGRLSRDRRGDLRPRDNDVEGRAKAAGGAAAAAQAGAALPPLTYCLAGRAVTVALQMTR